MFFTHHTQDFSRCPQLSRATVPVSHCGSHTWEAGAVHLSTTSQRAPPLFPIRGNQGSFSYQRQLNLIPTTFPIRVKQNLTNPNMTFQNRSTIGERTSLLTLLVLSPIVLLFWHHICIVHLTHRWPIIDSICICRWKRFCFLHLLGLGFRV